MVQLYPIAVGGLTPFSTVDYPGHLSAVVFCLGARGDAPIATIPTCRPWMPPRRRSAARGRRLVDVPRGLIDSVVFTRGEPLLQRGLAGAMWQVRSLGYGVGLHTAGIYPERLTGILPLVDWVGFDVKAPFCEYARITGAKSGNATQRSLSYLLASKTKCEVRCTADESLLSADDARRMAGQLAGMGVRRMVLQSVRDSEGVTREISPAFVEAVKGAISHVELR
jgi:pyruvate formate lyase activating enzyme